MLDRKPPPSYQGKLNTPLVWWVLVKLGPIGKDTAKSTADKRNTMPHAEGADHVITGNVCLLKRAFGSVHSNDVSLDTGYESPFQYN